MIAVLRGIIGFEFRCQVRQATFAIALALFVGAALVLVGTAFGPANAAVNSPYVVVQSVGLLTLVAIFLVTLTSTAAGLRDAEHGMAALVDASPAGRLRVLLGRFAGSQLAALLVMAVAVLVLAASPVLLTVPAGRLGPARPGVYLWAFAVLAIPNLLVMGAAVFAVASRTRSSVASWVTGVALYSLYWVTALLIDSPLMAASAPATPETLARAAILDPLGLSAFFEQTRYWGAEARNAQLPILGGRLLLNRLLWLGVAGLMIAALARRGRPAPARSTTSIPVARVAVVALAVLWVFTIGMEFHGEVGQAEYFTTLYPATGLLLNAALQPLRLFGALILVYFAADLAWRDRLSRMADIIDATPATNLRLYLPKLGALALLMAGLIALTIATGVAFQLARGYTRLELPLWLTLFPLSGMPLLLLAVLALLVQALTPNRWVGMLVTLALVLLVLQGGDLAVLAHPLTRFGALPGLAWSEMGGFGAALGSWGLFMACWAALALAFATITTGAWPRGHRRIRARLAVVPATLGRRGQAVAGIALAAFACLAIITWHQTTVVASFETPEQQAAWRAGYERAWRHTAPDAVPQMVAVQVAMDLFPAGRHYRMHGTARLENRTSTSIDTVRVVVRRDVAAHALTVAGARLVAWDSVYHVATFHLAPSMAPGDTATLGFDVEYAEPRFRADGHDHDIIGNGSLILSPYVLPSVGYRATYELRSAAARSRFGLREASALAALDTTGLSRAARDESWITLDAVVSAPADQVVVGSGTLERTWEQDGRRYFHYVAREPISGRFGFAAARYAVRRARHGGVDVEAYYHPGHGANVHAMLEAATRSLDYFGRVFGPYQYPVLRIAEVPMFLGAGALAMPGTIFFVEDRGFLTDARDSTRFDIVTRRMAHEVAHQWWGHQVAPATTEGATMVVETLAKYSEQLVLRERRGDTALEPLLRVDEDRYRRGAAEDLEEEPGLYRVADQAYIYYGKGGVVMHALRDSLGEEALNAALRRLVQEHGGARAVPATTLDLLGYLHDATPASRHAMIDHMLREAGLE